MSSIKPLLAGTLLITSAVADAQFGAGQVVMPNAFNAELRSADVDMDGDKDLVGVFGGDHVKWLPNLDGQGTFGPYILLLDIEGNCSLFEVADVDGDADVDILCVNGFSEELLILRNQGDGSFVEDDPIALIADPKALAVADVTGDGFADLVMTLDLPEAAGLGIIAGSEAGFGSMAFFTDLHSGPASRCLRIGDVDLVGGLDLILTAANDSLKIARNTAGDGSTWTVEDLPILTGDLGYSYRTPQLMDIDGDGDLDLGEARGSSVHWLRNALDEGGVLGFEENVIEPWTTSGEGAFGRSACGMGAALVYVPNNPGLPVRWNNYVPLLGDFPDGQDVIDVPRGNRLLLADLDGDDRDDLVLQVNNELLWFRNTLADTSVELELPLLDTLCLAGAPVALPEASPAGGQWYGQQVFDGLLYRANLLVTTDLPVVHAVFPEGACPLAGQANVRVIEGPEITTVVPPVICSADAPIVMNAVPASVQWFGLDGASVIDPAVWNGGYVVCEYTDNTGQVCSDLVGPIMRWNTLPAELEPVPLLCPTDQVTTIHVAAAPSFNVNWEGPVTNPTATSAQFDPTVGAGTYTVILNVEASGPNQCRNSDTIQVVVGELPHIAFEPMGIYCAEGDAIVLGGAEPADGTWSGTGVALGQLEPAAVGAGVHLLNYFAVSADGCGAQASTTITLASAADVTASTTDLLLCEGDEPIQFVGWPAEGIWNDPLDMNGQLEPDGLEPGSYTVVYTYADPQGCLLTNEELVVTKGAPKDVSIAFVPRLCLTTPAFEVTGSAAGTWSGAVSGEGASVLIDPAVLGVGTWPVTLSVNPLDECPGEASINVVVDVCTGINEADAAQLSAAPQPFAETTTVRFGDLRIERIEVFDAGGRRVVQRGFQEGHPLQTEIDLRGLQDGVYVLHAFGREGVARLRLVKAH
ncbi:MAG TPA: T9SS type A sorting domain-containing protein [Flavobacteriales bacterium]|nr:T9SS type A sorting domain-containing protein [Flavobacteriales bacterium]